MPRLLKRASASGPTGSKDSFYKYSEATETTKKEMLEISRHLGVTCIHCHDLNNYRLADKKEFKVAKNHMEIVRELKKHRDSLGGTPNCYLCHRGKAKPDFIEPKAVGH